MYLYYFNQFANYFNSHITVLFSQFVSLAIMITKMLVRKLLANYFSEGKHAYKIIFT